MPMLTAPATASSPADAAHVGFAVQHVVLVSPVVPYFGTFSKSVAHVYVLAVT